MRPIISFPPNSSLLMKLRVGLVGLGDQWLTRHRPALMSLRDRFEVRAICCEVAEKSRLAAEEFGAIAMDGFRVMVERDDIDAILALSPDWYGPLPILAACEAGKAVYSSAALDVSQGKRWRYGSESINRASRLWQNCRAAMPRPPFGSKSSWPLDLVRRVCSSVTNECRLRASRICCGVGSIARLHGDT